MNTVRKNSKRPFASAIKILSLLSIIVLGVSCSQVRVKNPKTNLELAPAPYFDEKTGIYFPGSLGPLIRRPVVNLEDRSPGLGLAISYRSPDTRIDVFVYDLQASIIPTGIDSTVIQDNFQQAIADLKKAAKGRAYSNLKLEPTRQRTIVSTPFLEQPFSYTESLTPKNGHILVSGVNSQILKIRTAQEVGSPLEMGTLLGYLAQSIRQSQRNGYGGIANSEYQEIRTNLAQIDLTDGLSSTEAISIAQITLVDNEFHNQYDVSSAELLATNLPESAVVSFDQYPTEPARYMGTPVLIEVQRDGRSEILEESP